MNVEELCVSYLASKKVRLRSNYPEGEAPQLLRRIIAERNCINRLIIPAIGSTDVRSVDSRTIVLLQHFISGGDHNYGTSDASHEPAETRAPKGTRSCINMLQVIFEYARLKNVVSKNPVEIDARPRTRSPKALCRKELVSFGNALAAAEGGRLWPSSVSAIRFMAVTGWRNGEVLNLKWADIDVTNSCAGLRDYRRGKTLRPLSQIASRIIEQSPKESAYIFPSARSNGRIESLPYYWDKILQIGSLRPDITPSNLRQAFIKTMRSLHPDPEQAKVIIEYSGASTTMLREQLSRDSIFALTNKTGELFAVRLGLH